MEEYGRNKEDGKEEVDKAEVDREEKRGKDIEGIG